jgi:hypothetical protein
VGESICLRLDRAISPDSLDLMGGYFDARYYRANNRVRRKRVGLLDPVGDAVLSRTVDEAKGWGRGCGQSVSRASQGQMGFHRIGGKISTALPLDKVPAVPDQTELQRITQRTEGFEVQIRGHIENTRPPFIRFDQKLMICQHRDASDHHSSPLMLNGC